jgi:hypothetical protein
MAFARYGQVMDQGFSAARAMVSRSLVARERAFLVWIRGGAGDGRSGVAAAAKGVHARCDELLHFSN